MSISLPEFTVTSKQFFTNGVERVELRVFDGKLYVMAHEGGSIVGGTLELDPLPASAIYGTEGLASSDGVNFTLTLGEQDFSAWTQADTDALIAALKAETGAAQVNITIEEGSVKAVCDFVLSSGADQAAKDAVVAKIDTVEKVNAVMAASPSATLQTAATQNNTATTPIIETVTAVPELLSVVVAGGNVAFSILGAYQAIQWKSGSDWITLSPPFLASAFGALEGSQTIEFRLLDPQSIPLTIPKTLTVTFVNIPNIDNAYSFNNTLNDSHGNANLPDTWLSGTYSFVNGGNDKYALAPAGLMNTHLLYENRDEFTVAFWVKYIRPPVAGDNNLFFDAGVRTGNQRAHMQPIGHGPWIGTLGDTANPLRMQLTNIWSRPFSNDELDDLDKNPTYDQIYSPDWAYHIISWKHVGINATPGGWMKYWVNGVLISDIIPSRWYSTQLRAFERISMNTPQCIFQDMVFYEEGVESNDVAAYMYNNPWVDPSPGPAP